MDDDRVMLARFDGNYTFREASESWSAEETDSLCKIAIAIHSVGLDWYQVNVKDRPFRFGRKSADREIAEGALGYLYLKPRPKIRFNRHSSCVDLGITDVLFEEASTTHFVKVLGQHVAQIKAWKAPLPSRSALWPDDDNQIVANSVALENHYMTHPPTNLILYGPPGTGKTFATAEHAVRLCGEEVPTDRIKLMSSYRALEAQKRIRFVTFHQSYTYEDFVEGLRPTTGVGGGGTSGGFQLEPVPGVFREIATLAEQAAKTAKVGGVPFELGNRQVFKMSLGRAGVEDHIFEAAVDGEYIQLGWGGEIDWTPYDSYDAIHKRWNEDHPGTSGNDSNIAQVARFRVDMKERDLVVVSYGNSRFRAICEVAGPYEYTPSEDGYYNRRHVRWLFVPDEPLPVSFYDRPFTMRSCYLLQEDALNREALALLLPSSGGASIAPKQFVLICDEINRANISRAVSDQFASYPAAAK